MPTAASLRSRRSFLPQCKRGFHVSGTTRGKPRGTSSRREQQEPNRGEHGKFPWVHAVGKDVSHRSNGGHCKWKAHDHSADENRPCRLEWPSKRSWNE